MGQGTGQKESAAALEAAAAFMAGEYARSLSVLRMLRDRASTDPKASSTQWNLPNFNRVGGGATLVGDAWIIGGVATEGYPMS